MIEDTDNRRARLTITNRMFLIEKMGTGFLHMFSRKWVPLMDINVRDHIELSLNENGKSVVIKHGYNTINISSRNKSPDILMKEIQRNIDISGNMTRNNVFSSKKVIHDLKKSRGIK